MTLGTWSITPPSASVFTPNITDFGGVFWPRFAAGATIPISSAGLQSGRARTLRSGFYGCSILIVVVRGWHLNESQSPASYR